MLEPLYEVHPDDKGLWILYQVGGGDFLVIAWFTVKEDAEWAQLAFEIRRHARGQSETVGA